MRILNVPFAVALVVGLAVGSFPLRAHTTTWVSGNAYWDKEHNWSNGFPGPDSAVYINNGGHAMLRYDGPCALLYLGSYPGAYGHLETQSSAVLGHCSAIHVGVAGGTGQISHWSGQIITDQLWIAQGSTVLAGGRTDAGYVYNSGTFIHTAGPIYCSDFNIVNGGQLTSTGGALQLGYLNVDEGTLSINGGSNEFSSLRLGEGAHLDIPPGQGFISCNDDDCSDFTITSTSPENVADLGGLGLILYGEGDSGDRYEIEVAGAVDGGFINNFALGGLHILGLGGPGEVTLIDDYDNSPGSGPECLFLHELTLESTNNLDLNGHFLYVEGNVEATLDDHISNGRLYDSTSPFVDALYEPAHGWTVVIPEPASLALLAFGGAALTRQRVRPGQRVRRAKI